jgi:CheY-like chemotaxis protein
MRQTADFAQQQNSKSQKMKWVLKSAAIAIEHGKLRWGMLAKRILIVDDEPLLRSLMADILFRNGFQTVAVENGVEAVRTLQNDSAFSLVLSDIHMPKMDGMGLLRLLRQDFPQIPVLMTSVNSTPNNVKALLQEGASAFLARPFTARQLVDAANEAISRS